MDPEAEVGTGKHVLQVLKFSIGDACRTYAYLLKIILPVFVGVTILSNTPVIPWLAHRMAPVMGLFGLTGGAAVPLIFGYIAGPYAAVAAIMGLPLSATEVTILAVMIGFSHELIVETAIINHARVMRVLPFIVIRVLASIFAGVVMNLLLLVF